MTHPLVTALWLRDNLNKVRVFDASYHLPNVDRDAQAEFDAGHIPGAGRFDIDHIADHNASAPHMVPSAVEFQNAVQALGVNSGDHIVFYDDSAVKPATRAWWMMRLFGHDHVSILDGGLAAWKSIGGALEQGSPNTPASLGSFMVTPSSGHAVTDMQSLLARVVSGEAFQLLDARAAARFAGEAPEPRKGLRAGHIPGSKNLPFNLLLDNEGRFLDPDSLRIRFTEAGILPDAPVTTTCGSGVTACVLALGLSLLGNDDVTVYDGSWSEWGASDAPIA